MAGTESKDSFVEIPAVGWEGFGDPTDETPLMRCSLCGGETENLSLADMAHLPQKSVVNENIFMIPGHAWGYCQCKTCEARRLFNSKTFWEKLVRCIKKSPQ